MRNRMKPSNRFVSDATALKISIGYIGFAVLLSLFLIIWFDDFRVFGSFWASGDAWRNGLNPFAEQPLTWRVAIPGPDVIDVNLNPPVLLPMMALFSLADMKPMAVVWLLVSLALALVSLVIASRSSDGNKLKLAWALSCSALVDTLMLGQIYALLLLLGTGVHMGVRSGRLVLSSACLGLIIAFKPNFALALVILCLAGHWRLAIGSGAIAGLVSSLSVAAFGHELLLQWITAIRADDHHMFPTTVSLFSYFARLQLFSLGVASAGLIVLISAVWAYSTKPDLRTALIVALLASMLASPLCWMHYTLVIVPFLMTSRWNKVTASGAMLIWLPQFVPMISIREGYILQATFGGIYTAALLLIGYGYMRITAVSRTADTATTQEVRALLHS